MTDPFHEVRVGALRLYAPMRWTTRGEVAILFVLQGRRPRLLTFNMSL